MYFDHFNTTNRGLERLDGMGTRDETIAVWESIVGEPAGDLTWYEVFSGYKVAILSTRTMVLMGDPNAPATGAAMALQRPSELTGIPIA